MRARAPLRLGLLPPRGGSLGGLAASGQAGRFAGVHLRAYAEAFDGVTYFSYRDEALSDFTRDPLVLARASQVWLADPAAARLLRSCDALRVFHLPGSLPALRARLRAGVPFAVTYGYDYARAARRSSRPVHAAALRSFEPLALLAAALVFAPTPALAAQARRRGGGARVLLLPNGVDTARFRPATRADASRTILFVGRLEPQKNLRLLLEAAARIKPGPRLLVVGDGSQRVELRATAERLGVELELRGTVPHEDLPDVYAEAPVFALPSHWEGHPKALLEAMSCGLACVGTEVPGTSDTLEHEVTGLLAAPQPAALAAALERALDDRPLAASLGARARAFVEQECDAGALVRREVALLADLAQRKRR